jgi:hypothetical protein
MPRNRKPRENFFLPTGYDIRTACEKIRENWSERERKKRAGLQYEVSNWTPPEVSIRSIYDAARDMNHSQYD